MSDEDEEKYSVSTDYGFEVYRTEKNMVAIRQENPYDDDEVIVVSPERVETLIAFLRNVKDEILTDRADEAQAKQVIARPELA